MSQRGRSIILAAYLLLCILLGGSSQGVWRNLSLQLLGIAIIAWAAMRPRAPEDDSETTWPAFALLGLGLLVVLLQLVPLPASIWTQLPGRSAVAAALEAVGAGLPAMPLSLAPYESVRSLFGLIPGLALFLAVLVLRPSPRWLALAVVAGMTFSIALGAFQAAGGRSSWAYLYSHTNLGAVGVFANLNHMGTLLLVSIPFATALLVSTKSDRGGSRQGRIAIGIAGLVLILTGIFLNGSLAVLALAPPVLLASAALVPAAARWRWIALPLSVLSLIGAVGLLAFSSPGSTLSSLSESTSVKSRQQLWTTATEAIRDSFPAGTGLGTFEQAYRQHEKPAEIVPQYVNNAHNDYLEFVLELGAPGLVLIVLFLAWWGVTALKVWTSQLSTPVGRSATIASAAILAHSIVDYPLRTSAIMAIFGAALAMMVQRQRSARPREERQMRSTRHVKLG